MKKTILALIVCLSFSTFSQAQRLNFLLRGNLSVGLDYQTLDYDGSSIIYSPGGGIGLEPGVELQLAKNTYAYATAGYQFNLSARVERSSYYSNKTSFSFNRKFFTVGANQLIPLSDGILNGLMLGGGGNFSIPGKLTRFENDYDLGSVTYKSGIGFHVDAKLRLKFSDNISMDAGLRYRNLELKYDTYDSGGSYILPDYLQTLNASGIEISATLVQRLGGKK